jgi:H+/Na+-translocating ferredoxin:NAD+ oxidoreductase subunit G
MTHSDKYISATETCRLFLPALVISFIPLSLSTAQQSPTVHEYLSADEALSLVLPGASQFVSDSLSIPPDILSSASQTLRRQIVDDTLEVVRGYNDDGEFVGYAVIGEEVGKYRPITFMTGMDSSFTVTDVAVMVYRENRGDQVQTRRFLRQYRGKTSTDPIRINRDVINISGATLSVRAMNKGVKRVLFLVTAYYSQSPPASNLDLE